MTVTHVWQQIMESRQPGFNTARGYVLPEVEPKVEAAGRWGLAFEDAVCELAGRVQNSLIVHREKFCTLERLPIITCHLDGIYDYGIAVPDSLDLHEGKTTTDRNLRENWGEPGTDKVPVQYQVQTQHQMLCTGARRNIVSVLAFPKSPEDWEEMGLSVSDDGDEWTVYGPQVPGEVPGCSAFNVTCRDWARNLALMGYFHQYPVEAKPEAQELMVERYRLFWERHVLTGIEPEPVNQDDVRRLFPAPSGTLVITPEMEKYLDEIGDITEETGTSGPLAKRKEALKTAVIEAARKMDRTIDDESRDKTLFMNEQGKKRATWNGKTLSLSRKK